jgi:hypothetical protein
VRLIESSIRTFVAKLCERIELWGGATVFIALMTIVGLVSLQTLRSDASVTAVTILVITAIVAALFARMRKID